ncbi:hypothetical protein [Ornithinimicrobium sp. INDO-MA30-4]|uniref:hypothetical protein n=1 Tax=Ornithinimicrobium sp. INDO-MA30-4 TaxID=2908651 RepID=UPI001F15F726|nr:hypothetical protein [Ornithinimicrobium sp. INDO-MA30-4]UJH69976.1 hypothetical protein L0A91_12210 [Ornithinimicrobium sp. INDO-MA30-4]
MRDCSGGFALPVTMFSGRGQLEPILAQTATVGLGYLAVVLMAKTLVFALSMKWGFLAARSFRCSLWVLSLASR